MKKRFQLLALSVLCAVFAHAQYVAPSEGVFRIVNVAYNAALMEDFLNHKLYCTSTIGGNSDYEQLWILKKEGTGYSLQNVFTGAYVQTGNSKGEVNYWTDATAKEFSIVKAENGYNIFDPTQGSNGLHSKGANGNVVKWVDCEASQWQFAKVSLTDGDIAAAREEFARLTGGDKLEGYQTVLDEVFTDKACTMLSEAYAAKSAEEIEEALTGKLPAELVAMAVKVKNNAWAEANEITEKKGWDDAYAKKFRVQMIEPYSIAGEITEWIGHQGHTNMDNPTGLYAKKREVFYIMVEGEVKEGAELWANWIVGHSKMPNYNNGYSNGIRLHQGLNVIPMTSEGKSALYINYLVHTFDKEKWEFGHKLSDFDDLKVHVEGGYINGYYNVVGDELYTPDNDDDWVYYEERANLENITILGRYEILQFELNDVVNYTDDKGNTWSEKGLAYHFPEQLPTSMPNSPAFTAPNQRINGIVEAWDRIFLSEKMTLGVASKAEVDSMNKLFPRYDATWTEKAEIYNYDETLDAFCDSIKDRDGDYGEYYNHHGLAFGTRSGYMYGSYDHSGYHINTTPSVLTCIATEAGPTWGPAHEIGHQHQALYTLNGEMEVTNNTFANVAAWYMGMGTSRVNATDGNLPHVYDNFKNGGYLLSNNIWALTQRYYRLWLYYHRAGNNTQFFPRLFELIRKNPMERSYGSGSEMRPVTTDGKTTMEEVGFQLTNGYRSYLHFYKLCCEAAQEDLTEFFRAYGCFVPVDGVFQGDYTNSKYYTTQKEIDKAIAEVKAKGYPVNNKVLFINDCTPDVTYGHDGKTKREYWDNSWQDNYPTAKGYNAEVGCYVDYLNETPITGEYVYTLEDLKLTISGGQGAVGFAVYNKEGEIQAFSNHHSFELNREVELMMRAGESTLYAVGADGKDVAVVNKVLLGTPESLLVALKKSLKTAQKYLEKTDSAGTMVGYLIPDSVKEYSALVAKIDTVVIAKADTTEYTYGEWYVKLEAATAGIELSSKVRVPLTPDCFYTIAVSGRTNGYLAYTEAGLTHSTGGSNVTDDAQWRVIPAEKAGTYYLQNRQTGYYVSIFENGNRVKATSSKVEDAVVVTLVQQDPGEFFIQLAAETGVNLYNNSINRVNAGKESGSNATWALRLQDTMLDQPKASANGQITFYYLQRTDNREYAYHIASGRNTKGRIGTQELANNDANYWFYFIEGNEEEKYAVYNYGSGKSITVSSKKLYADKDIATAIDYSIALNEEGTGMVISSEDGYWNMSSYAELNDKRYTSWKLQRAHNVSIEISQAEAQLEINDALALTATATSATLEGITLEWSSSNNDVATVDADGNVKAIAAGEAIITAAMNGDKNLAVACKVTVEGDASVSTITTDTYIESQGSLIVIGGVAKGAVINVYDVAGKQVATATATDGNAIIDTKLPEGSTVIVKIEEYAAKIALQ